MKTYTLVTGANGFIASEVVYQLLQSGKNVIGTVRNESRTIGLRKQFAKELSNGQLRIMYCEMDNKSQLERMFKENKDIDTVIHMSSSINPPTESGDMMKTLIMPSIIGTKYMVEAIYNYAPQVETMVYTSSIYTAIGDDTNHVYSNKDWIPLTMDSPTDDWFTAYSVSKKYSELALWDFIQNHKVNFKLKTLIVPLVLGPMRIPPENRSKFNLTNQWVLDGIRGKDYPAGYGQQDSTYGDVRYVAQAHVIAADKTMSPRVNNRYLIFNERFNFPMIYEHLAKRYPNAKVNRPKDANLPAKTMQYDVTDTENDLKGLKQYKLKQTLDDLCDQYDKTPET